MDFRSWEHIATSLWKIVEKSWTRACGGKPGERVRERFREIVWEINVSDLFKLEFLVGEYPLPLFFFPPKQFLSFTPLLFLPCSRCITRYYVSATYSNRTVWPNTSTNIHTNDFFQLNTLVSFPSSPLIISIEVWCIWTVCVCVYVCLSVYLYGQLRVYEHTQT